MSKTERAQDPTYPLRTACRLTGLSPEVIRAWERRYGVVEPVRTPGGTRRYSAEDLERLRLVKAAVDAGSRIGEVAGLEAQELRRRAGAVEAPAPPADLDEILDALDRLDGAEAQRLLSVRMSLLGPTRFARDLAMPLVREIGERWVGGRMGIAAEHLATAALRSMLGSALQPAAAAQRGPRIVFATPPGERHEIGLLMAALTAMGAGANPVYLGTELPVENLLGAVRRTGASVLALGLVAIAPAEAARFVETLYDGLPDDVQLWLGGAGAASLDLPADVERLATLDDLEQRAVLLGTQSPVQPRRRASATE